MTIEARAPLRVSFAGGGTDVSPFPEREGGLLVNATINRYARVILRPRDDDTILVTSLDYGVSAEFAIGAAVEPDGRLDLATGAIAHLGSDAPHGFELILSSDVPPGSGLGASSAMVVAVVAAMLEFRGTTATREELAELAYAIECDELEMRAGRQDAYAASFGGFNLLELSAAGVTVNSLRLAPEAVAALEQSLVLCFTGITREGAYIIEDQLARFEDSDADAVAGLRRQKELALEIRDALLADRLDLDDFGRLLAESWEAKKRTSPKISNARIEQLYATAIDHGAVGGKLAGAGGGGYLLLCCGDARDGVQARLSAVGAAVEPLSFERRGVRVSRDA